MDRHDTVEDDKGVWEVMALWVVLAVAGDLSVATYLLLLTIWRTKIGVLRKKVGLNIAVVR